MEQGLTVINMYVATSKRTTVTEVPLAFPFANQIRIQFFKMRLPAT
jgi:hypothetical protein